MWGVGLRVSELEKRELRGRGGQGLRVMCRDVPPCTNSPE